MDHRRNNYGNGEYRDRARIRYRDRDPRDSYSTEYNNGHNSRNNGRGYGSGYHQGYNQRQDTYRGSREATPDTFHQEFQQQQQFQQPQQQQKDSEATFTQTSSSQTVPKEELISRYLKKLFHLRKVQSIDEVEIIDSQWGVKPKGFDNVTVQRAKLSGLFPLPGYPRPVDFTKIEDSLNNGKRHLLDDSYKIEPLDSRNAKIVIVKGIDFEKIDHLKVTDFLDKYLAKIDIEETSLNNIESKRKTKDDRNLIIQFKNNVCATIILAINGKLIPVSQVKHTEEKDDIEDEEDENDEKVNEEEGSIELMVERPGEYVTQCLPPYKNINTTDIEETVVDNPRKCTLLVDPKLGETELLDILKTKGQYIKSFQLLREIGTKESLGVCFFEYYFDPTTYKNTIKVIPAIENLLNELKNENPSIERAFLSCVIPGKTGIEDCPMDFNSLKALAKGEYVTNHPKLKVIELINLVTAKDLIEDSNYKFIYNDILQECKTFGEIKSIKIPRPANDFTPGISQFLQPGLGKIYVEFDDEQLALDAIMGLAGRMYNDRTVLCAFHNHQDFLNGIL